MVRASHPTWLSMQLPMDIAQLLGYDPKADGGTAARSISFLTRGSGLLRVVATYPSREALAVETVRNRLIATARPGERLLFTLPTAVSDHLGLKIYSRGERIRGTDDSIVWIVPAPEYYEYRAVLESGKAWTGPSNSPFAHVYLARSLIPFPRELDRLAELEYRLEEEEWRPAVAALQHVGRARRVVL